MGVKDWIWILEGESKNRFERALKGSGRTLLTRASARGERVSLRKKMKVYSKTEVIEGDVLGLKPRSRYGLRLDRRC